MSLLVLEGLGGSYLPLGGLGDNGGPGTGGAWSGWRKILTTDQYGHLVNPGFAAITDLEIGDSYSVLLSGPTAPPTTIAVATLDVDTMAGANLFSVTATLTDVGSDGSYALGFHITPAQTRLLSPTEYRWSITMTTSAGDVWTPIDGSFLLPRPSYAV